MPVGGGGTKKFWDGGTGLHGGVNCLMGAGAVPPSPLHIGQSWEKLVLVYWYVIYFKE